MILQALVDYYNRKSADPEANMAPQGFEYKEIPFLVILNEEGEFVDLLDTREKSGKKLIGRKFRIPKAVKRAGKTTLPNFLWDNISYVFGIEDQKKAENGKQEAFLNNLKKKYPSLSNHPEIQAVVKFLQTDFLTILERHPHWRTILLEEKPKVTFQIHGQPDLVCQHRDIEREITAALQVKEGKQGVCLLTGEIDSIARLHHLIQGVQGAKSIGANIVSYNFGSAESFGKKQGDNAPIGARACFAYTTALNHLLRSKQKIRLGDAATVVFWAARQSELENVLSDLFDMDIPPKDDPDRMTRSVKSLYDSPHHGVMAIEEDPVEFYVLGISPNDSRLSISFWWRSTVLEMAENIRQHFDDLKVDGNQPVIYSLYRLLSGVALQGDMKNLQPNLVGSMLKSIFQGTCYPYFLLPALLRRLKDKEGGSGRRASLIKAWLNRYTRNVQINEKEIQMSLDENNQNIGYRLGRLFAVLEKIQKEAHGSMDSNTIRERFYGAASSVPITVFANLLKLKNHHLAKLENRGRAVNFEKMITRIMESITDFPATLALADQGRFAIGYYHQYQNLFSKQES